jgi:hypothetical protein
MGPATIQNRSVSQFVLGICGQSEYKTNTTLSPRPSDREHGIFEERRGYVKRGEFAVQS